MKKTLLTAFVLITLALGGCDSNEEQAVLRVMTRNVYVGADVDRVIAAQTPEQLAEAVIIAWQEVQASDFRRRAEALADEILAEKPHIIGLQEITTFRTQTPGDAVAGGTVGATEVAWDYLAILLAALEDRGLAYRVAGKVEDADVELPLLTGMNPLSFTDVRLTDYDVVLVAPEVTVTSVVARNFEAALHVVVAGAVPVRIPRGYVMFDAEIDGQQFRFASSHLEPASQAALLPLQQAQAAELIQAVGIGAAVVVGDLNSAAPDGASYQMFMDAGFRNAWRDANPGAGGATCCFHSSLVPGLRTPDAAFDLVLYKSSAAMGFTPDDAVLVGTEASADAGGILPSDHVGVSVRFR